MNIRTQEGDNWIACDEDDGGDYSPPVTSSKEDLLDLDPPMTDGIDSRLFLMELMILRASLISFILWISSAVSISLKEIDES